MSNRRLVSYFSGFIVIVLIILVYMTVTGNYITFNSDSFIYYYNSSETFSKNVTMKRILEWTDYENSSLYTAYGEAPFKKLKCQVSNCIFTSNKSDANVDTVDAILFDMWSFHKYMNHHNKPLKRTSENVPKRRNPSQRYVFQLLEAPNRYNTDLKSFNNFFNWTMTYRRDSDIFKPYGHFVSVKDNNEFKISDFNINITWNTPIYNDTYMKELVKGISNKTKLISWVVSNCNPQSKRQEYVKELQKYVEVDIYGRCGTLTCPGRMSSECYEMLENKYKFYLSFENSLCKDYVTEKLFNITKYNIVPIVYGEADYSKVAPPGSYINVKDFKSPRDLAEYLIYLDNNDMEYVKYFWWKSEYRAEIDASGSLCKLCEMLNDIKLPNKSYDIYRWYSGDNVCSTPTII